MKTPENQELTSQSILATLHRHRIQLKSLKVRKIGLFGSYRRGTNSEESDLDFLVQLDQPTFDTYMELKFFLEDLFSRKVDLVMEESLEARLRTLILEEVIYAEGV